jgi:hypothetical protein
MPQLTRLARCASKVAERPVWLYQFVVEAKAEIRLPADAEVAAERNLAQM